MQYRLNARGVELHRFPRTVPVCKIGAGETKVKILRTFQKKFYVDVLCCNLLCVFCMGKSVGSLGSRAVFRIHLLLGLGGDALTLEGKEMRDKITEPQLLVS